MSDFLVAQFENPDAVLEAARGALSAGIPAEDALCSTPVQGLFICLAPPTRQKPIGWIMFLCGVVGASTGYFMQWYSAVIDYPTNSGGRPLNSWPAYLLVPYEMAILFAAVIGLLAWMWLCGLPKLFHPVFEIPAVQRANQDRYFLVFKADRKTQTWLDSHWPGAIVGEEP